MNASEYQPPEAKSSVKISTTAQGKPLPEVKVYEGTTQEELDATREMAVAAYKATAQALGVPV